ncbi:MAG: hypothetical protein RLZ44_1240 [Pseudomonadota bacterium]
MRNAFTLVLLAFPLVAPAAGLVLNDLKAQNARQLSKEELQELVPNANVVSHARGNRRTWKNKEGGKFIANTQTGRTGMVGMQITGDGTWHIGDNGAYCVTIEWPKATENWCKYIFKTDGKYYGVKSLSDGAANADEFVFTK